MVGGDGVACYISQRLYLTFSRDLVCIEKSCDRLHESWWLVWMRWQHGEGQQQTLLPAQSSMKYVNLCQSAFLLFQQGSGQPVWIRGNAKVMMDGKYSEVRYGWKDHFALGSKPS